MIDVNWQDLKVVLDQFSPGSPEEWEIYYRLTDLLPWSLINNVV